MFVDVRGCSLVVVGVPVKLRRMTRREESNYGPGTCRCLLLLSVCFNCALITTVTTSNPGTFTTTITAPAGLVSGNTYFVQTLDTTTTVTTQAAFIAQ